MQNADTHAARIVLRRYMEFHSEDRWAVVWRDGLENTLALLGDDLDAGAFRWLVQQAGGWWTSSDGPTGRIFVEGTYGDLQRQAQMADLAPHLPPGDSSWEAVAHRLWDARYKFAQFLAVATGVSALGLWLRWDENTTMLVGVPAAVLILVPDPPLWRMPLRSSRRRSHTNSARG